LMLAAWTRPGPFPRGKHYHFRVTRVPPAKPHPPIWVPGTGVRDHRGPLNTATPMPPSWSSGCFGAAVRPYREQAARATKPRLTTCLHGLLRLCGH
jgi:alkanesulfonate monooxygenase SsuD/methylene tetrahydromethanopterin reductase-like flavin-dependent oxidoreductase (luciferase family)